MTTKPLQLAILVAALSSCAAGPSVCAPSFGDSAEQLQRQCGKPQELHRAVGAFVQEEWRYGEVYIGLIDGSVSYILQ